MIAFDPRGNWQATGLISACYRSSYKDRVAMALLCNPATWTLEQYSELNGEWQSPSSSGCLSAVHIVDFDSGTIEFSFRNINGTYRLWAEGAAGYVDTQHDRIYFREDGQAKEPFSIYIEGHGKLDYYYLNQQLMPSSISQKVNHKEGISTFGGLELSLVDIDGFITESFAPAKESPKTISEMAVDKQADTVEVLSTYGFDAEGELWIERELVSYEVVDESTIKINERGLLRTQICWHPQGCLISQKALHLEGRMVYLERHDGSLYYSGVVGSFSPDPENLACYRVELADPLAALDVQLSSKLAQAELLSMLSVDGRSNRFRVRWLDGRAIGGWLPSVEGAIIEIKPGIYDTGEGQQGVGHIAYAIKQAFAECGGVAQERFVSVSVDEDGRLRMNLMGQWHVELLPDREKNALGLLGYPEEGSLALDEDGAYQTGEAEGVFVFQAQEKVGDKACGSSAEILYIQTAAGDEGLEYQSLGIDGGYLKIDQELLSYKGMISVTDTKVCTLLDGLEANCDDDCLLLSESENYAEGALVMVGQEYILLGRKKDGRYYECTRSACNSGLSTHSVGETVSLVQLHMLYGCRRGLYGSEASAHDGAAVISELVCSDDNALSHEEQSSNPVAFLAGLLCDLSGSSLAEECGLDDSFSLNLPVSLVDLEQMEKYAQDLAFENDSSFLAILDKECNYRDVAANLAMSLGAQLIVNSEGRISLKAFKPKLLHESSKLLIDAGKWIGAPSIAWQESGRINRVEIELDRNPISGEYESQLLLNDRPEEGKGLYTLKDHTASFRCDYIYTSRAACISGGASAVAIALARKWFAWFNRPYCAVEGELPLDLFKGLGLMDTITLDHPLLPAGDGIRGIENMSFDIVEYEPDLSANSVHLVMLERGSQKCGGLNLALDVLSWDESALSIRVVRPDCWPQDMQPCDVMASGDKIKIKRRQNGESQYCQCLQVIELKDLQWRQLSGLYYADIVLNEVPDNAPCMGDILVAAGWDEHEEDSSIPSLLLHLADEDGNIGADDEKGFVYSY